MILPQVVGSSRSRVYLRKPWAQTLEEMCRWREAKLRAGEDRWPGTMVSDPNEKMLGKWLANQRSYRKAMDANPLEKKGLKGMCPERVRILDERLPGWMGTSGSVELIGAKEASLLGLTSGGLIATVSALGGEGNQNHDSNEDVTVGAVPKAANRTTTTPTAAKATVTTTEMAASVAETDIEAVSSPQWSSRATFRESLERAERWRASHPDRWPIQQDKDDGDVEEGKVYRWLIEQRRYKRNFESGKSVKLGGMTLERLDLIRAVLGDDWHIGNRAQVNGKTKSTARSLAREIREGGVQGRASTATTSGGSRSWAKRAKTMQEGAVAAESEQHAAGDVTQPSRSGINRNFDNMASLATVASVASHEIDMEHARGAGAIAAIGPLGAIGSVAGIAQGHAAFSFFQDGGHVMAGSHASYSHGQPVRYGSAHSPVSLPHVRGVVSPGLPPLGNGDFLSDEDLPSEPEGVF